MSDADRASPLDVLLPANGPSQLMKWWFGHVANQTSHPTFPTPTTGRLYAAVSLSSGLNKQPRTYYGSVPRETCATAVDGVINIGE